MDLPLGFEGENAQKFWDQIVKRYWIPDYTDEEFSDYLELLLEQYVLSDELKKEIDATGKTIVTTRGFVANPLIARLQKSMDEKRHLVKLIKKIKDAYEEPVRQDGFGMPDE